ncbi:MAG TPA: cytochrome c-type biogenesis protein [Rhizomicrobium sp.]|jgi:cytochrome c-type biogenesis protein CcmH
MRTVIALLLMMVPALAAPMSSNAASAGATAVGDTFSNPATEARARNLQRQLRCLVCQGESIDESGSPFAADVRHLVRQEIADGKSDQEIEDFLVARYGDFILMKPPLQADTWLLWLAPFVVLVAGGTVAWITVKKASRRSA